MSDAAGAAFEWSEGKWSNVTIEGDRGVASVGYEKEKVRSVALLKWPEKLLTGAKSRTGKYMGSKSGTLEAVGLLLPFLTRPASLAGHHVVLGVDNQEVMYGWEKKHCGQDPETSVLLRCLHVIEALLHCKIYVVYVKRCSTNMAVLADSLTRKSTTDEKVLQRLRNVTVEEPVGHLLSWLKDPKINWNLPLLLCEDVEQLLKRSINKNKN